MTINVICSLCAAAVNRLEQRELRLQTTKWWMAPCSQCFLLLYKTYTVQSKPTDSPQPPCSTEQCTLSQPFSPLTEPLQSNFIPCPQTRCWAAQWRLVDREACRVQQHLVRTEPETWSLAGTRIAWWDCKGHYPDLLWTVIELLSPLRIKPGLCRVFRSLQFSFKNAFNQYICITLITGFHPEGGDSLVCQGGGTLLLKSTGLIFSRLILERRMGPGRNSYILEQSQ